MLRKIDLALSPEPAPDLLANKNMLCAVQITWHGGVKQSCHSLPHQSWKRHIFRQYQDHLLSEEWVSITGNNTSRNRDLAHTRCPLTVTHSCWAVSLFCLYFSRQGCRVCSRTRMLSIGVCMKLWKGLFRLRVSSDRWGASTSPWSAQVQLMRSTSPATSGSNAP